MGHEGGEDERERERGGFVNEHVRKLNGAFISLL